MPTKQQMDRVTNEIEIFLGGMNVYPIESSEGRTVLFWNELVGDQRKDALASVIDWQGFSESEIESVIQRVIDGEDRQREFGEMLESRRDVDGSGLTAAERDLYYHELEGATSTTYRFSDVDDQHYSMEFQAADLDNATDMVREDFEPVNGDRLTDGNGNTYSYNGESFVRSNALSLSQRLGNQFSELLHSKPDHAADRGKPAGRLPHPLPGEIARGNGSGQVLTQGKPPDMGWAEWIEQQRKGDQGDNANNDQNDREKGRSQPDEQREKEKEQDRGRTR